MRLLCDRFQGFKRGCGRDGRQDVKIRVAGKR